MQIPELTLGDIGNLLMAVGMLGIAVSVVIAIRTTRGPRPDPTVVAREVASPTERWPSPS
uniref:Uncharacterized protein n=1 Tax=Candidatus Kentrum sp. MB TaxID=2138164 RepID=A0A450XNJ5_9GAMM|nr:MAG: hypothetical protein BECKMB1821G_GA0114241_10709 [Candidatus Kentron sp. MB]VFK34509.1 MAG: hypothetical protein BECKMB1821I_GA0114274_10745 [Candidatus Kentron sp. MB]VFK76792.1 MAG: hypothetical protein BECKMB1821H_GA0114242_10755 [Candidatus Kentron sp. MB]